VGDAGELEPFGGGIVTTSFALVVAANVIAGEIDPAML
jgi:hypothetical protein